MLVSAEELLSGSPTLPMRKGKRLQFSIRGPLHVQCSNHGDNRLLRQLVEEVVGWPGIEPNPLPVASADLVSIRVGEDITKRTIFPSSLRAESLEEFCSARQLFISRCR